VLEEEEVWSVEGVLAPPMEGRNCAQHASEGEKKHEEEDHA